MAPRLRYDKEPGLRPEDPWALRQLAHLLNSHPQLGSMVPPQYLRNLADRIEALLQQDDRRGPAPVPAETDAGGDVASGT